MSTKKMLVLLGVLLLGAVVFTACAGPAGPEGPAGPAGPAGPQGPAGPAGESAMMSAADLSCTECHNDTAIITGKAAPLSLHKHVAGTAWSYAGGRAGCSGCHSGASFPTMVASGVSPDDSEVVAMTPISCRACHQIHTSYTGDDWALTTTDPVSMYAFDGVTFDGGKGNLCASCHQARRAPVAENGVVNWSSTHYGPHHGPQSNMLLGIAGAGLEGKPASHYSMVEDTCVACHMGDDASHGFAPNVAACQGCHADAENFDINGTQTEVKDKLEKLKEALIAKGMLTEEDESVVGEYPEAEGNALWNYIFIAHEDKSMGVHNPTYTNDLLDASLEAMGVTP